MANLSQIKREKMLSFLETLKEQHSDDESLMAINQIERELTVKKYGLVWEEHEEEVDVKMRTHIPVFTEDASREIVGDLDNTYNFLLEGDNLHTLKLLEKTHKGKVDVVYIDPPYNTGNRDFIYNDSYVDNEDAYKHSKWLSFMKVRLETAKRLLSKNALVFISIDDNELYNLKILCDEVFGDECYLSTICIETSNGVFGLKAKHSNKTIVKSKDYIVVYAMDKAGLDLQPLYSKSKKRFDTHFTFYKDGDYECSLNEWLQSIEMINLAANKIGIKNNISNLDTLMSFFPEINNFILSNAGKIYRIRDYTLKIDDDYLEEIEQGKKVLINGNYVFINKDNVPLYLYPFSQLINKTDDYDSQVCSSVIVGDLWKGFNDDMGNVGKEGNVKFSNGKKPVRLIKNVLKLVNNKSALVLDFFAGSGTTGQAVIEMNKEDGGSRRFILCTNNENNICDKVTYQRLQTVIMGKRADGNKYSDGVSANMKYYKTSFVAKDSDELCEDLIKHVVEMIQLQYGVKIDNKRYIIIMNDDEMDVFEQNIQNYNNIQAVFINQDVLLSSSQERMLQDINTFIIPDCYFDFELREAGELW